jgi:hypothetical protein
MDYEWQYDKNLKDESKNSCTHSPFIQEMAGK